MLGPAPLQIRQLLDPPVGARLALSDGRTDRHADGQTDRATRFGPFMVRLMTNQAGSAAGSVSRHTSPRLDVATSFDGLSLIRSRGRAARVQQNAS